MEKPDLQRMLEDRVESVIRQHEANMKQALASEIIHPPAYIRNQTSNIKKDVDTKPADDKLKV